MIFENGYKTITTFYEDFTIAEKFGPNAILDTYKRVMKEWSSNYKYLTELVLILNFKIWKHYKTNENLSKIYNDLWQKTDNYAYETLKGEELTYYLETID